MIINVKNKKTILLWLLFIFQFFLLIQIFLKPPSFNYVDFPAWVADGSIFICKLFDENSCTSLSKFPLAYLLNSLFLYWVPSELRHVTIFLINCSFVIFSICFVHFVRKSAGSKSTTLGYLSAIIFTIVPPFYIYSGGIEIQYGILLGIFSVSLYLLIIKQQKSNFISAILFFSALILPFYKDISVLLVMIMFGLTILLPLKTWTIKALIQEIIKYRFYFSLIFFALTLSLAIIFRYNFFRYGSIFPLPYIDEASNASPPFLIKAINLFWLFFSPNGGLIFAWSAAFFTLLFFLWRNKLVISRYGVTLSLGLIGCSMIILSNWWTPFGWEGWGNRLILPAAFACLIIISCTPAERSIQNHVFNVSVAKICLYIFCILILTLSFAYVGASYSVNRDKYLLNGLWGSDSCKAVAELRSNRPMWEFKKSPIHLQCHQDRFQYWPGKKMNMSPLSAIEINKYTIENGISHGVIGNGWSNVEKWGVWSDSHVAEIRFISKKKFDKLIIELQPFIYGDLKSQNISGYIFGKEVFNASLTATQKIEIVMPDSYLHDPNEIIILKLTLPNATSPAKLNLSTDNRLLAVGLLSLELR